MLRNMSNASPSNAELPRSPELMSVGDTALLVVDVQSKLVALVPGYERLVWNVGRLIDGATLLGIPVVATEQYPKGLGPTVPELAARLGESARPKLAFSCGQCGDVFRQWEAAGISKVLLAGIESHVCVQQTALDLLAYGLRVYLAVDAIGARYEIDHRTALRRMESSGATLTTTEAALFEWCRVAGTSEFKQISALVRSEPQISNLNSSKSR